MNTVELWIKKTIKLYESDTGWGDSDEWTNQDFIILSEKIQERTGEALSYITLKRVWGKVKYDSLPKYKERCWPTNKFFKKVHFVNWADGGDKLFLVVEMTTTDNKLIRNVDVYTFKCGKMESMDCFFGSGGGYPGNGKK